MSLPRAAARFARNGVRQGSSGNVHPNYNKVIAVKERMSLEDGIPVHVKNGTPDRILYGITMGACVLAVVFNFKTYWDMAMK